MITNYHAYINDLGYLLLFYFSNPSHCDSVFMINVLLSAVDCSLKENSCRYETLYYRGLLLTVIPLHWQIFIGHRLKNIGHQMKI